MLDDKLPPSGPESQLDPFASVVGQTANGCWLGYGSALFLEFGERAAAQDLKNHRSGEWSLQRGDILWRIEQGAEVLAGSEDDRTEMEAAIQRLNGLVLLSGEICEATGDSILRFTDNVVLRTFAVTSEEDVRWCLRHGEAEVLRLGSTPATGSEPPAAKREGHDR